MQDVGQLIRSARNDAGLSQRDLATLSGTSAATIALYETGKKEPRLSTLSRIIDAAGADLAVEALPRLTAPDRRSLAIGRAIAEKLHSDPARVRAIGRSTLARWRRQNPDSPTSPYWDEWERLLAGGDAELIEVLTSTSQRARALRPTSPFPTVLSEEERLAAVGR
ncbi:MAG TPA: helix-turn-helix transcriptional regulator [Acidimicrobiales bacterium]|nr:helix-turn-helix transcriptional regulator [Acidimicrobiales bacterium]